MCRWRTWTKSFTCRKLKRTATDATPSGTAKSPLCLDCEFYATCVLLYVTWFLVPSVSQISAWGTAVDNCLAGPAQSVRIASDQCDRLQLHCLLCCCKLMPRDALRVALVAALGDWLAPTVAFFHFMYYTDTCALLFVMLCFWLAVRCRRIGAGALCGAFAVLVRQTNVVWVLVCGRHVCSRRFRTLSAVEHVAACVCASWRVNLAHLLRRYWSFVVGGAALCRLCCRQWLYCRW
jgi:hypothetical protein